MSCTPHPQVISPCADDAVSVGQALGTRGDVSFDEYGSVALEIGQTDATIDFTYEKESEDYRFEYLYIKTEDSSPVDVRPVPNSQTTKRFTVALTGVPITANSKLYWRVVVPDALQQCQTAGGGPNYAILAPPQSGVTAFPSLQTYVDIAFPVEQPDTSWEFDVLTVEAPGIGTPIVFSTPTVTNRTTGGCRLHFQASPGIAGYFVHWRIS